MAIIELSTGAAFPKENVARVLRFREKVEPAETHADGVKPEATEREVLVIEMKEGPAERVIGEHAAIDAAKLKEAGFGISET
jgi:hypothetical protein